LFVPIAVVYRDPSSVDKLIGNCNSVGRYPLMRVVQIIDEKNAILQLADLIIDEENGTILDGNRPVDPLPYWYEGDTRGISEAARVGGRRWGVPGSADTTRPSTCSLGLRWLTRWTKYVGRDGQERTVPVISEFPYTRELLREWKDAYNKRIAALAETAEGRKQIKRFNDARRKRGLGPIKAEGKPRGDDPQARRPTASAGRGSEPAKPQARDQESEAAEKLKMAKSLRERNPEAAERRLLEIIEKYPNTAAAREARDILEEMHKG
jgi:hypothetical protein